jgi:hypothetical protein
MFTSWIAAGKSASSLPAALQWLLEIDHIIQSLPDNKTFESPGFDFAFS